MNSRKTLKLAVLAVALAAAGAARAEPAVIFDMGGKFDKSFNQSGYDGAERWKKETGKPYLEFEISNPAQREQAALDFNDLEQFAPARPRTHFRRRR